MKNYYAQKLQTKRLKDSYSAEMLSDLLGIPNVTLNGIENESILIEQIEPSSARTIQLYLNDKLNTKLDVQFDWVGVTFKTLDYGEIIRDVLMLNINMMELVESSRNNYSGYFSLGDIKVYFHHSNEIQGTHISFSGNACREYESIMEQQGKTWYDFFVMAIAYNGRATRIDLAINDYVKTLDIPELYQKFENGELVTTFKKIRPVFDKNTQTNLSDGMTIYFGSVKSDFFFRFYEKDLEQQQKTKLHKDTFMVKNRYECVIKGEKARDLIEKFTNKIPIEDIAFGLVNNHIKFYDKVEELPSDEWHLNGKWVEFIGNAKSMKLNVSPKSSFYEKTVRWLREFCSKSIYVVQEVDRLNNTTTLEDMIEEASNNLDRKHAHMIKVATADIKDLII